MTSPRQTIDRRENRRMSRFLRPEDLDRATLFPSEAGYEHVTDATGKVHILSVHGPWLLGAWLAFRQGDMRDWPMRCVSCGSRLVVHMPENDRFGCRDCPAVMTGQIASDFRYAVAEYALKNAMSR